MKSKKKKTTGGNDHSKHLNPYLDESFYVRKKKMLSIDELVEQIIKGDRNALSKAITLVESKNPQFSKDAGHIIEKCLPFANQSIRIGITGIPGVGKSSFIEKIGLIMVGEGHKVAVLTIDPSSQMSKGSILGDKTRMLELAKEQNVFIRPTPAGDSLGGVARSTRETILLCEAAGFDTIIIETVGVGQSETLVHSMVDIFLLLLIPGAGDELQGMKRGIMEMADIIAVNKADGNQIENAATTAHQYKSAVHLFPSKASGLPVNTLTCSALTGDGIKTIWEKIEEITAKTKESGYFEQNRKRQAAFWFDQAIKDNLIESFFSDNETKALYGQLKEAVLSGHKSPFAAATEILAMYKR